MNYIKSQEILKEIKKSGSILINCHISPDSDSVSSALALKHILESLFNSKKIEVVCVSDIPSDLFFLEGASGIKKVDFSSFDFSSYDLFIIPDSSDYTRVTGLESPENPPIRSVVIDHHFTNRGFGDVNLIDSNSTSTGEILYKVFNDWEVEIGNVVAECLLTGILGDTGTFQYQNVGAVTLETAADLIKKGADKDKIVFNLYRSIDFKEIKMWGKIIDAMKNDGDFVWSAIPFYIYKDFGRYTGVKENAANLFLPIVEGTDFGIIMIETSEKNLSVSLRSRADFDVAKIAGELGGGGHKVAAAARIEGLPFQEAVDKVLSVTRKHAKKN